MSLHNLQTDTDVSSPHSISSPSNASVSSDLLACDECGRSDVPLRLSVSVQFCEECWSAWTDLVNKATKAARADPSAAQKASNIAYTASPTLTPTVDT